MQKGKSLADIDAIPPTIEEYLNALSSALQKWRGKAANRALEAIKLQMEHGGEITPSTIADHLGYAGWLPASQAYGRLGHRIAEELNLVTASSYDEWWYVLSTITRHSEQVDGHHFSFVMRPHFRVAVERFLQNA